MSSTVTTPTAQQSDRPSGRHPVNVGHLVMGIAFLGIAGVWALIQSDVVGDGDVRWLLPLPLVVAGIVGLTALALTGSRRWATRQTGWVGEEPVVADPDPVAAEQEPEPAAEAVPDSDTQPDSEAKPEM